MTTEEIDKAVKEYTESLKSIAFENLSGEETPYLLRGAFKEGLEFANNHWQEKTKWKSLEKEPPKLGISVGMAMSPLISKYELIEHLENCLKQPIAQIGNIDYQKGYRQSISDFIDLIKLRWGN